MLRKSITSFLLALVMILACACGNADNKEVGNLIDVLDSAVQSEHQKESKELEAKASEMDIKYSLAVLSEDSDGINYSTTIVIQTIASRGDTRYSYINIIPNHSSTLTSTQYKVFSLRTGTHENVDATATDATETDPTTVIVLTDTQPIKLSDVSIIGGFFNNGDYVEVPLEINTTMDNMVIGSDLQAQSALFMYNNEYYCFYGYGTGMGSGTEDGLRRDSLQYNVANVSKPLTGNIADLVGITVCNIAHNRDTGDISVIQLPDEVEWYYTVKGDTVNVGYQYPKDMYIPDDIAILKFGPLHLQADGIDIILFK